MIHLVFCAFITASLADISAQTAKGLGELTAPGHITGRQAANLCAIHIQLYAARHATGVLFMQAGNCAVITFCSACIAGVDARLKLLMGHIHLQ